MIEGKIIKFYRELKDMKQSVLGYKICSGSHISKIERGLTEVSKETIELLSNRLGIDMESEIEAYLSLDKHFIEWHESIIMKQNTKAEDLKKQLENVALLQMTEIYRSYTLLLTRYYLLIGEFRLVHSLIKEMDCWSDLTPYEKNMLLHIKGIDLLYKEQYQMAISLLQEIDLANYNNPEYYYHLAIAYHSLKMPVLAYFYFDKSLQFFTSTRNFPLMIEVEMLMLIQVEQDQFFETGYQRLIKISENSGLKHQRSLLFHNLAYQHLRQGHYEKACEYYKQSMDSRDPLSKYYLVSLEGYLNASTKKGFETNKELLLLAEKGISLSKKLKDTTYKHFFQLHIYNLKKEKEKYYDYLETYATPYFSKIGNGRLTEYYSIKLFDFHMEKGNNEKVIHYAKSLVEKLRNNDSLV
ncbi:helix-turn-helix domain-containing protein [Peribacillus alkalitolerans]|uniref:helix-turn-helix domain-containing protein n=1 Tax=Peribacillus alkalitolerans TaxID=1550385 RepID=UPI0013D8ACC7|nr:helix-turn-helix transcriptional regulator [Peribacillus alkalitolerans]